MPLETLAQATARLVEAGFADSFRAETGGLRALDADRLYRPEELVVEEIVRFEGESDPGDEAVLFALRAGDGLKGTYSVAFGTHMPPADAEVVPRLDVAPSRRRARP